MGIAVGIWRDLHKIKRKGLAPGLSPTVDHAGEEPFVHEMCTHIAFPLVPDGTGNGKLRQRIDHGIVGFSPDMRPPGCRTQFFCSMQEVRVMGDDLLWRPYLCRCSTPVAVDQPHWKTSSGIDLLPIKISNGTEMKHVLGIANNPFPIHIILRSRGSGFGHIEKTDLFICRIGGFLFGLFQSLISRPFHVALPTADPHFPDQHIFKNDFIVPFDGNSIGPSC